MRAMVSKAYLLPDVFFLLEWLDQADSGFGVAVVIEPPQISFDHLVCPPPNTLYFPHFERPDPSYRSLLAHQSRPLGLLMPPYISPNSPVAPSVDCVVVRVGW